MPYGLPQSFMYAARGNMGDGNGIRNRSAEQRFSGSGNPALPMFNTPAARANPPAPQNQQPNLASPHVSNALTALMMQRAAQQQSGYNLAKPMPAPTPYQIGPTQRPIMPQMASWQGAGSGVPVVGQNMPIPRFGFR